MVAILHMQLVEKKSWMASKLLCCKKGDCPLTCEATWLCMHRSVSRTDDCEVVRIGWGLLFSKCVFLRVSELIGQDIVCGLLHGFNGSTVWVFCIQWTSVWQESGCIHNMRKKVVQSLYKARCHHRKETWQYKVLQWKSSNMDTLGPLICVLIRGVSPFQGANNTIWSWELVKCPD